MNKPKSTRSWPGGISIIAAEKGVVTTSGSGMTERHRLAPLDAATASVNDLIRPAEEWAKIVLNHAGIVPDGTLNGTADTEENYAQRFILYGKSIRGKISKGDSAGAVVDALLLGGFIRESQLKYRWENHVEKYDATKETAKAKGALGAAARWAGDDRDNLNKILAVLANKRDAWGDYLFPLELWPMLLGDLDKAHANPIEETLSGKLDAFVIYGNDRNKYPYDAFRRQINRIRGGGT